MNITPKNTQLVFVVVSAEYWSKMSAISLNWVPSRWPDSVYKHQSALCPFRDVVEIRLR